MLVCGCASSDAVRVREPWVRAVYRPGLIGKPWEARVASDGTVDVCVPDCMTKPRVKYRTVDVERLRSLLASQQFADLPSRMSEAEDVELLQLSAADHVAVVYGPRTFCGDPAALRFLTIWRVVVDAAGVRWSPPACASEH